MHRTSYYSIQPDKFFDASKHAFYSWLETRGGDEEIDLSKIGKDGTFAEVGANHRAREDAFTVGPNRYARYSQMVTGEQGVYSSQLTLVQQGYEAWAQIEVFAPRADSVFRSPVLTRELIKAASDASVDLWPGRQSADTANRECFTPGLQRVRVDGVGDLLDEILEHPERRAAAIVAGTGADYSYDQTLQALERVVNQSVGVATLWVLDPEATDEFNALVPAEYQVFPSSLRTFQPGLDTRDTRDAYAHRYVPARDLFGLRSLPPAVVGNRLYHGARTTMLRQPVAEQLQEADALIRERTHLQRLAGTSERRVPLRERIATRTPEDSPAQVEPAPASKPAPDKTALPTPDETRKRDTAQEEPKSTTPAEVIQPEEQAADRHASLVDAELLATLKTVAGVLEVENYENLNPQELVLGIGELADQEKQAADKLRDYAEELEAARIEIQIEKEIEESELEESIEELSKIEERELDLRKEIAHLQRQLAELKAPKEAYVVPEPDAPESMRGVLEMLNRREYSSVVFTGDEKEAFDLDDRPNARVIARVAWEAVNLLRDYAELPAQERKSVHAYIVDSSTTLPPNKHAASETSDLRSNPVFSQARYLPVPASIAPEGRTHMWAHFKLSQAGGKAPRMHYLDATGLDGKIYVGYIGKHLQSRLTT